MRKCSDMTVGGEERKQYSINEIKGESEAEEKVRLR